MSTDTSSVQPAICYIPDSTIAKCGAYTFDEDMCFTRQNFLQNTSCICEIRNECSDYKMLLFVLACIIKNNSMAVDETAVPITEQYVLYNQKMLVPKPDTVRIFLKKTEKIYYIICDDKFPGKGNLSFYI